MGWIDAGLLHLDPGAYDATVLLPEGSALEQVELAPPCLHPIEPRGGWKPQAVTTTEDVAVTVLQALDLESELPPAAPPIELRGSDLKLEDGTRLMESSSGGAGAFRGGPRGSRAVLVVEVPETGLYTLSVFGVPGGGQRWMADGCRKCIVCPSADPLPRWRVVLSGQLQKGQHVFSASLGPDTVVERIRLEQKKDTPARLRGDGRAAGPRARSRRGRSPARRPRRRAASSSAAARSRRWSCAARSCGPGHSSPTSPPRARAAAAKGAAKAAGARAAVRAAEAAEAEAGWRRRWWRGRAPADHPAAAAAEPGPSRPLRGRELVGPTGPPSR